MYAGSKYSHLLTDNPADAVDAIAAFQSFSLYVFLGVFLSLLIIEITRRFPFGSHPKLFRFVKLFIWEGGIWFLLFVVGACYSIFCSNGYWLSLGNQNLSLVSRLLACGTIFSLVHTAGSAYSKSMFVEVTKSKATVVSWIFYGTIILYIMLEGELGSSYYMVIKNELIPKQPELYPNCVWFSFFFIISSMLVSYRVTRKPVAFVFLSIKALSLQSCIFLLVTLVCYGQSIQFVFKGGFRNVSRFMSPNYFYAA